MVRNLRPALRRRFELAYSLLPERFQAGADRLRKNQVRKLREPIYQGISEVTPDTDRLKCSCSNHDVESVQALNRRDLQVVFVWDPLIGVRGSTRLRVFQAASRIANAFPWMKVSICPIQSRDLLSVQSAIVIVHKNCQLQRRVSRTLKRSNCLLVADYVDGPHERGLDDIVDGFICSSATEYAWIQNRIKSDQSAALVPHGVDDRFLGVRVRDRAVFRCCYFGVRENGLYVSELEASGLIENLDSEVTFNTPAFDSQDWAGDLAASPFQYIARPSHAIRDWSFKPFTKGFLAAHLGQLVVAARFDAENRYWLGDDYPFYVEEENLDSAIAAIKHAELSWEQGDLGVAPATLQRLRSATCPVQNAIDYRDAFIHISR